MTTYNVADYVGAAIQSVLSQTLTDFELIIIDDGSTDNTIEVTLRHPDPRVRLEQSSHRGAAVQMCRGFERTQAPYLAFLDADDLWDPLKLEQHVAFLDRHPEVDLTFSWSRIIDESGRDTGLTARLWNGPLSFSELLADNVIGNGSALVLRRQALVAAGGIDSTLEACYDLDAWLRIALLRSGNIWAIPQFLTSYRRRRGQLTGNIALMQRCFEQVIEKARKGSPEAVSLVEFRARCNMQRFFAYSSYQAGDYGASARRLTRSLCSTPATFLSDFRNWKMSAAALAGLILPSRWHQYLIRTAVGLRRA